MYTIINKSDTFLQFNINGVRQSLSVFGKLSNIHDSHITKELKFKAQRGDIALVYQKVKDMQAIDVPSQAKPLVIKNKKTNKSNKK